MQEMGLRLLHYADNQAKYAERLDRIRLAVLTSKGPDEIATLFPDLFPEDKQPVASLDDAPEGAAIDYSGVEWMTGDEAKSEYERLMQELESDGVEVVGAGAEGGGDWL